MDKSEERQYKELRHTWHDIWKDEDISVSYRFARPTVSELKRMQHTAAKNTAAAAQQLVIDTIHPDDKEKFLAALEIYPLLVVTLSTVLVESCGMANLGNG
jgi:hypothetical protein